MTTAQKPYFQRCLIAYWIVERVNLKQNWLLLKGIFTVNHSNTARIVQNNLKLLE